MTLTNTPLYVLNKPVTSDAITPDNISKKASKYFSPKPSKVDDETSEDIVPYDSVYGAEAFKISLKALKFDDETFEVVEPSKVEVEEWKECLHCEDNENHGDNMQPVEVESEPFQGMKNDFFVF